VSGITAIVPHWNRRDLLEPLLDRLRGQTCPVEEVLVVDNGSEDGSVELAKSKGARVIASIATSDSPRGKRGIREARTGLCHPQ